MPQLIVDPITAILTIDTNIVTIYQGMNKDIKQQQQKDFALKSQPYPIVQWYILRTLDSVYTGYCVHTIYFYNQPDPVLFTGLATTMDKPAKHDVVFFEGPAQISIRRRSSRAAPALDCCWTPWLFLKMSRCLASGSTLIIAVGCWQAASRPGP